MIPSEKDGVVFLCMARSMFVLVYIETTVVNLHLCAGQFSSFFESFSSNLTNGVVAIEAVN